MRAERSRFTVVPGWQQKLGRPAEHGAQGRCDQGRPGKRGMRGKNGRPDARMEGIDPDSADGAVTAERGASLPFRQHQPQARVAIRQ
jgi:hypothetical protein